MTGAVGLDVKEVWGLDTKWKQQFKRWCPDTSWFYDERGTHMEEWEVECILTEENELPGSSYLFWRKTKGNVMYTSRREH